MPGDPPCWSHLFEDYSNQDESDQMPKSSTTKRSKTGKAMNAPGGAKSKKGVISSENGRGAASDLKQFLSNNQTRIETELFDFLRIPSVSAKSEHNGDTKRAADWVKAALDGIGVPAKIYPT